MEFISRFIALVFIAASSPFFFIISFMSLIFQGTPIFYIQKRVGKDFRPFNLLKFRTMKDESGSFITKDGDERITQWGKILRRTKLDELPQLLNVLVGDMHFVGPRPEVPQYVDKENFAFLKMVKPGMTDFASILFRRESEILQKLQEEISYEDILRIKVELANEYVKRKGPMEAIKIICLTICALFFHKATCRYLLNKQLKKPEFVKYLIH